MEESLEARLAKISHETKTNREAEEKDAQEKELEPVRDRIKELEAQKYQFEILKGSLDIKSDKESGKGMKEGAAEAKANLGDESKKLDELMEKYKDAIEVLGIKDRDQFLDNAEFADAPEVIKYKQAKEDMEIFKLSDSKLEKKLAGLGINIGEEGLNYESAEALLSEKMEATDRELLVEKLKTPEGREEAVDLAAEQIAKMLPAAHLEKPRSLGGLQFKISTKVSYEQAEINVDKDKAKFENWQKALQITPEGLSVIEDAYGQDIAEAGLRKAYDKKVEQQFNVYDKKNDNTAEVLKIMEGASEQNRREALARLRKFELNSNSFRTEAAEKVKELRDTFPNVRMESVGDVIQGLSSKDEIDTFERILTSKGNETFPPNYDWQKLSSKIEKLDNAASSFMEELNSLKTEEQAKEFFDWNKDKSDDKGIRHYNSISYKISSETIGLDLNIGYEKSQEYKSKFSTTERFLKFITEQHEILQGAEGKTKEVVGLAIDAVMKRKEFEGKLQNSEMDVSVDRFDDKVVEIQRTKSDAEYMLQDLARLEIELPDEEVQFDGNSQRITILSVSKEWNDLGEEISQKRTALENLELQIKKYPKEPRVFGRADWKKDLDDLNGGKNNLDAEIKSIGTKRIAMFPNIQKKMDVNNYNFRKWLESQGSVKGKPSEIFASFKKELSKYTEQRIPEDLLNTADQYKKSTEKLK